MRSSNLFVIKIPSIIEHRLDPVPPRLRTGNLKYVFSFNCTCSPLKARHGQNMPRCVKKRCLKLAENTMGNTWSTIKFWGTQCFRETNIRNPQDPIVCPQIVNNISIQTSHICLSSFPKKCPMLTQAHHPHIPCCDILGYYYYTIIVTKYEFKNQSHDLKVYQYQIRSSGILHYIHSISHLLGSDWDILVNTPPAHGFRAATPCALVWRGNVQWNARRAEGGRGQCHQGGQHPGPWQETTHCGCQWMRRMCNIVYM